MNTPLPKFTLPRSFLDDLLTRTDIVEIIRTRISLKKAGTNYQARCPFHDEKTPSFTVSGDKQFYHCFGCGVSGDAIAFVREYDRLDFIDAVKSLAATAGMSLPENAEKFEAKVDKTIYDLLEKVKTEYYEQLKSNAVAIDYMKSRNIDGRTVKRFSIGFAPPGWRHLVDKFTGEANLKKLIDSGMAIDKRSEKDKSCYDRFRDRVMFPIHDLRGRVIGFGGRCFDEKQNPPKYLNSPESPIFHKRDSLYGLYEARQANRDLKQILVVEGYMDVVALAQHDITYAVATLGTACTARHIQLCFRYTHTLIFCFDGDRAGREAAWRALTLCLSVIKDEHEIKFLFLPDKQDPDSIVNTHGKVKFEAALQNRTLSLSEYFFKHIIKEKPTTIDAKSKLAREAQNYLCKIPKGLFQQLMHDELAKRLDIAKDSLQSIMQANQPATQKKHQAKHFKQRQVKFTGIGKALSYLLQYPLLAKTIDIESLNLDTANPESKHFLTAAAYFQKKPEHSCAHFLSQTENPDDKIFLGKFASSSQALTNEQLTSEFEGILKTLQANQAENEMDQLMQKISAGQASDEDRARLQALISEAQG